MESKCNLKVWCTFQVVGFHSWPKAPKNVAYLRRDHRHVFHFKVTISVPHPDRSQEFHNLKSTILEFISYLYETKQVVAEGPYALNFGHRSCETIAKEIIHLMLDTEDNIIQTYRNRVITVEVSEDGENGGIAEFIPEGN